jgi:UrcA family protein
MNNLIFEIAVGAIASTLFGGIAVADDIPGITVEASRQVVVTQWTDSARVSLTRTVNAKGLDLTTSAGSSELEARVNDAAQGVCKELARLYPDSWPKGEECVKNAAGKAMHRAHEMVAAAKKNAGK